MTDVTVWEGDLYAGTLPPICALTGAATSGVRPVRYQTVPGWAFLLILFGIAPFLVAWLMTRRVATGWLPLSAVARRRLAALQLIWYGVIAGSLLLVLLAAWLSSGVAPNAAASVALFSLLAAVLIIFGYERWFRAQCVRGFVGEAGPWGRWVTLYNVNVTFAAAVENMYAQRARQLQDKGLPLFPPSIPGTPPPWAVGSPAIP